jgi:hypothetical protein
VLPVLLVSGLALALLGTGWYRSHSADAAEREGLERQLSSAEDSLSDLKGVEERCRAELSARPKAVAAAAPKAAPEPPAPPTEHAPGALEPTTKEARALDVKNAAAAPDEPSAGVAPAADARATRSAADGAAED